MPISRRLLISALALPIAAGAAGRASAAPVTAAASLAGTDLIYLSPLRQDGRESRCQGEVWFVHEGRRIWVVTASAAWRTRAVARGLTRARIWVGDVGLWKKANGRYRALPNAYANASLVRAPSAFEPVLERFGSKYRAEWLLWGPRFRNGLADGSRVLLQYDLA